ncbi:MAG TPA: MMPL family transporter [Solimonas sp.]|nr:MMPL family transporter [Solimonas sp.]
MQRLIRWIAEHPLYCLLVVLLVSAAAFATVYDIKGQRIRLTIDPTIERLLPEKGEDRAVFERARETFGDSDAVLLAVTLDEVFTERGIGRIDELTTRLATLPGIRQVSSLANVPNPMATGDMLDVSTFGAQAQQDPARIADFPKHIAANPIYRDALVSKDGKTVAFSLSLGDLSEETFRRQDYTGRIRELAREVTDSDRILITGGPVIKAATVDAIINTLQFTLPAVFGLIVIMLLMVSRSFYAMLVGAATIVISLLWTMASAVLLDIPINLVTAIVPPLLLTLGLSYAVHLQADYFAVREQDPVKRVQHVLEKVGPGLVLSGATTVAGFLALMPQALPAIRQFAALCALGVTYGMLLTLVFLTSMLRLQAHSVTRRPLGERFFMLQARRLAVFDLRWRNWIIGIALATIPIDLYFASRIHVGTEYIKSFDEDAPVRRDFEEINRAFNGASIVSILIETHVNDALTDPELIRQVEDLQHWLRRQPEVGSVVSYVDHLKLINQSLNEGDPAYYAIPREASAVKQLLVFGGSSEIKRAIDSRFRSALLTVRINVDSSAAIQDFILRAEDRLKELKPPLNAQLTGSPVLATRAVNAITSGQISSIFLASFAIWVMLSLMFTSPRAALLAMLPNLLPVLLYFGILGITGISLNPTTSMIASIVLGIAVDDTIHFLARFNADARAKGNETAAVKSALASILRPVTFTVLSLCVGFLVFTGSELKNQVQFGALASFTLFIAWFADILLTPALGSKLRIVTLWDLLRLDLGQSPQHTIPLLSGLSLRQARVFALMSKMERHHEGARLIRHGDLSRDIYVVVDGTLEAWIERPDERKTLATLGRGAVLGEAGYFGQRRTANVDAVTPVRVLRFDSQDLERLRIRYPRIAAIIFRNLNRVQAERIARTTAMLT